MDVIEGIEPDEELAPAPAPAPAPASGSATGSVSDSASGSASGSAAAPGLAASADQALLPPASRTLNGCLLELSKNLIKICTDWRKRFGVGNDLFSRSAIKLLERAVLLVLEAVPAEQHKIILTKLHENDPALLERLLGQLLGETFPLIEFLMINMAVKAGSEPLQSLFAQQAIPLVNDLLALLSTVGSCRLTEYQLKDFFSKQFPVAGSGLVRVVDPTHCVRDFDNFGALLASIDPSLNFFQENFMAITASPQQQFINRFRWKGIRTALQLTAVGGVTQQYLTIPLSTDTCGIAPILPDENGDASIVQYNPRGLIAFIMLCIGALGVHQKVSQYNALRTTALPKIISLIIDVVGFLIDYYAVWPRVQPATWPGYDYPNLLSGGAEASFSTGADIAMHVGLTVTVTMFLQYFADWCWRKKYGDSKQHFYLSEANLHAYYENLETHSLSYLLGERRRKLVEHNTNNRVLWLRKFFQPPLHGFKSMFFVVWLAGKELLSCFKRLFDYYRQKFCASISLPLFMNDFFHDMKACLTKLNPSQVCGGGLAVSWLWIKSSLDSNFRSDHNIGHFFDDILWRGDKVFNIAICVLPFMFADPNALSGGMAIGLVFGVPIIVFIALCLRDKHRYGNVNLTQNARQIGEIYERFNALIADLFFTQDIPRPPHTGEDGKFFPPKRCLPCLPCFGHASEAAQRRGSELDPENLESAPVAS